MISRWSGWVAGLLVMGMAAEVRAETYIEYYRENLFLGLAYHRVGCMTDWYTIQSDQDYDGFTDSRYCFAGATAASVPDAEWYDWNFADNKAQLDACGEVSNDYYGTPNYAERSDTCNYNIFFDCNSDCWIERFSICQGKETGTRSPCL